MAQFEQFSDVVITTDRFRDAGVPRGSAATVLDVYPDGGYELQAFDEAGATIGLFSARAEDLTSKR